MPKKKKPEASLARKYKQLSDSVRNQQRRIQSLEKRLETRTKREEIVLAALGIEQAKPGDKGAIGELQRILLKNEELLLSSNKRVENILNALKNHREVLIRLNKKVYKETVRDQIKLELAVMQNQLSILGMSGFEFDATLLGDIKRLRNLLDKDDSEMAKIKKRKETLDKKFESEMGKFDLESVYQKKKDIPGYL